jgi:hypothetical protein
MDIIPSVEVAKVVDLNNSVAHRILDGDVVSAMEVSLQASVMVRDLVRRSSQQGNHSMDQDSSRHQRPYSSQHSTLESPCSFLQGEPADPRMMNPLHHSCDKDDGTMNDNETIHKTASVRSNNVTCYFHPHPIEIDMTRLDQLPTMQQQDDVISYAVLYNFGLCHHIFALVHSRTSRDTQDEIHISSLRRAITFYEYAHDILGYCEFFEEADLIHSLLGIANNLGHAHYFLQDDEKAKNCFERIWSILMYMQTEDISISVPTRSQQGTRLPLDLEGFLSNASYHCMMAVAAPAA